MNLFKPKAGDCDAGCGCHAPVKPGNKNWVIGVIVLPLRVCWWRAR